MTDKEMKKKIEDKIEELEFVEEASAISHMSNEGDQDIIQFRMFMDYEGIEKEE